MIIYGLLQILYELRLEANVNILFGHHDSALPRAIDENNDGYQGDRQRILKCALALCCHWPIMVGSPKWIYSWLIQSKRHLNNAKRLAYSLYVGWATHKCMQRSVRGRSAQMKKKRESAMNASISWERTSQEMESPGWAYYSLNIIGTIPRKVAFSIMGKRLENRIARAPYESNFYRTVNYSFVISSILEYT